MEILKNLENLKKEPNLITDYDEYYLDIKCYFIYVIKGSLIILLICVTFYRSIILFFIILPISLIYPFIIKKKLIIKRKKTVLNEFKDFLNIVKSFLEASYGIENAFLLSIKDMVMLHGEKSLFVKELKIMCQKIRLNITIENVFKEFSDKVKIEDIDDFSDILIIVKGNGGNINKVIKNTINVINEKIEIENDIEIATAEKRFEQNIMNLLPFFMILYMNFTQKNFLSPLYETIFGRLLMTFALIIYFTSYHLSKKILDIEV